MKHTGKNVSGVSDINMLKKKEPLPEHFDTDEEAGKFWDTHSAADYWDEMEEAEVEFDIKQHSFLVPINEHTYQLVKKQAEAEHRKVSQLINILLDQQLMKTR